MKHVTVYYSNQEYPEDEIIQEVDESKYRLVTAVYMNDGDDALSVATHRMDQELPEQYRIRKIRAGDVLEISDGRAFVYSNQRWYRVDFDTYRVKG